MKIKFRGTPQAPQKSRFLEDKAEMGYFSQKGLFYNFEILHGLLSNKNIRNPKKKIFGEFPLHPHFDRKMGKFGVDGGLSKVSLVRGHGSEDPHRFFIFLLVGFK